jgi:chromosome segregation ATPase
MAEGFQEKYPPREGDDHIYKSEAYITRYKDDLEEVISKIGFIEDKLQNIRAELIRLGARKEIAEGKFDTWQRIQKMNQERVEKAGAEPDAETLEFREDIQKELDAIERELRSYEEEFTQLKGSKETWMDVRADALESFEQVKESIVDAREYMKILADQLQKN